MMLKKEGLMARALGKHPPRPPWLCPGIISGGTKCEAMQFPPCLRFRKPPVKFKHEEHGKHNGFSLSVDKEAQVQRIGAAADMAYCLGKKPDGSRCNNVVNRSECEFCLYHAKAALKHFSNRRPDVPGRSLFEMQLKPVVDKGGCSNSASQRVAKFFS
ncbi:hypothetical protein DUNSADRAFT_18541 [Dunaliella salina]|uniref:Zinc finger Mcm10/DnaG-type domain-containing protein n=1 Tax=Dunaliella salina TaxID=3046 RepID=A0ABQ7FZY5_DUNSA|nr:hypothetical protein DUNSADRAFT_18541 [Dunaliella salina]|eukprot:KAF5827913.1 hypothetical protein DUNSADRAFT_18541 [Dunaliella salina]